MAAKDLIIPFDQFDLDRVVATSTEIRRYNRQRFEMEQLTAICHEDTHRHICVGYKDLAEDEFWARGHMPGAPLMPGVIMCEAAAQMCSYFATKHRLLGDNVLGLAGMDEVRFREPVRPGQRFVVMAQLLKIRPKALVLCRFQGFVGQELAVEGKIKGTPLPAELVSAEAAQTA